MSTSTLDRLVRKGTPADIPVLTRLLSESAAAQPLAGWLFPDPRRRAVLLPRLFRVYLDLSLAAHGVYTTVDLDCALLTLPPGATALTEFQQGELERRFAAALGPDSARVRVLRQFQERAQPQEWPHCHLLWTGVAADLPGRADLLTRYLLGRSQTPFYLEAGSPELAAEARLLGFADCGPEIRLPCGPALRPMWRPV